MLRRFFLNSSLTSFHLLSRLPLLPSIINLQFTPTQQQLQSASFRRLTTAAPQSPPLQDQLLAEIQKDSAAESITAPLVDWQALPLPSQPLLLHLILPPPPPLLLSIHIPFQGNAAGSVNLLHSVWAEELRTDVLHRFGQIITTLKLGFKVVRN